MANRRAIRTSAALAVVLLVALAIGTYGLECFQRMVIANNLRLLQLALQQYQTSHPGERPHRPADLLRESETPADKVLTSPIWGKPEVDRYRFVDDLPEPPPGSPRSEITYSSATGWYVVRSDRTIFWRSD